MGNDEQANAAPVRRHADRSHGLGSTKTTVGAASASVTSVGGSVAGGSVKQRSAKSSGAGTPIGRGKVVGAPAPATGTSIAVRHSSSLAAGRAAVAHAAPASKPSTTAVTVR